MLLPLGSESSPREEERRLDRRLLGGLLPQILNRIRSENDFWTPLIGASDGLVLESHLATDRVLLSSSPCHRRQMMIRGWSQDHLQQ